LRIPITNTEGGTRTHTPLRETDFESVASANSATPATQPLYRAMGTADTGDLQTQGVPTDHRPGRTGFGQVGMLARRITRPPPRQIQSVIMIMRSPASASMWKGEIPSPATKPQ
jgi:hypothetical protein